MCSAAGIKLTTSYVLQLLPVVRRKHKGSLSIMDKDRCCGLLLADAANPCSRESLQPHYPSIDFSSTPTEQDTASNKALKRTAGENSKAHCSLQFQKNCLFLILTTVCFKTTVICRHDVRKTSTHWVVAGIVDSEKHL